MRHVVNFSLLIAFLALSVTGVMQFLLPFSNVTTRVHIVVGFLVMGLVLVHVLGRLTYFRIQLSGRKASKISRTRLSGLSLFWTGIIAGTIFALPPFDWLVEQGYESRKSEQIVRSSSLTGFGQMSTHQLLVARDTLDANSHRLSMYVSFREELGEIPAIAVWAESTNGTIIETLYLDQRLAFADQVNWHGTSTMRNHILPIWRNRFTALSGIGPDGEFDAISGATNTHRFALDSYLQPGMENNFVVCVEVNAHGDANEHWRDKQIGQPSLLYTALVKVDDGGRYKILELTGHGGGAESNGNIQYNLEQITDAKKLVDLLLVKLEPPKGE